MATHDNDAGQPLYLKIKRWIREAVARGDYQPGVPFTTERELREKFGVSNATAVKALSDLVNEGVLVRQRGRGTFVADASMASGTGEGSAIAYVTHGQGPHQSVLLQGMSAAASELGFRLYVTDTGASREREASAITQALDSDTGGVVWYPHDGPANQDLLSEIRRHNVPIVFVDRHYPDVVADAVIADNFAIGHEVTGRLIELGHDRIATLWSEWQCTSVADRLSGHIQALREHQLPVTSDLTVLRSYVDQSEEQRLAYLSQLIEHPAPPTVMMCSNGFVLAAVAHDLVGLGVSIPDEIDLAGMDDAGPYDLLPIAVVAAHLPAQEMGETAVRILAERITGKNTAPAEHVVLPVSVRHRDSSKIHLRPVSTAARA